MARQSVSRWTVLFTALSGLAFAVWTILMFNGVFDAMDARVAFAVAPALDSWLGQIASAIAVITHQVLLYMVLLVLAIWAFRRRMRRIAAALALSVPLGGGLGWLLTYFLDRDRPEGGPEVITQLGASYPSGHLTAITIAAFLIAATVVVTRQSTQVTIWWRLGGIAVVALVAVDRLILRAHWFSDLIGSVLFGTFVALACLWVAGVKVVPPELTLLRRQGEVLGDGTQMKPRCAVIFNPTKVTDEATFRRHVNFELRSRGWAKPIWLETTEDDAGAGMTAVARNKDVDLVIGAGGDGTIRAICGGLAGSDIPFGLIPAGTGNLLAKNLGIPLDEQAALELAFDGADGYVDLVTVSADGGEPEYFCVMAGIGVDAAIISATNPDLKKAVGSAAYFVAAAQNANHAPLPVTVYVDDDEPFEREAAVVLVGNVGHLQGGIPLIPDAEADDGLLDLLVASPSTAGDWVNVFTRVMTKQRRTDERLDRFKAKKVVLRAGHPDAYQLDGDTLGEAQELEFHVDPGALRIRLPK